MTNWKPVHGNGDGAVSYHQHARCCHGTAASASVFEVCLSGNNACCSRFFGSGRLCRCGSFDRRYRRAACRFFYITLSSREHWRTRRTRVITSKDDAREVDALPIQFFICPKRLDFVGLRSCTETSELRRRRDMTRRRESTKRWERAAGKFKHRTLPITRMRSARDANCN